MSFKHPLIIELKGHILEIAQNFNNKSAVDDSCTNVLKLCDTIERIFLEGCFLSPWNVLDEIAHLMNSKNSTHKSLSYLRSVNFVKSSPTVTTQMGKLRLFIRTSLVNKCLHTPIEILVRYHRNITLKWYHMESSVIGNEILGEIFLSVLLQCSTLHFNLDLENSRFLDITSALPHCVFLEFVPCNSLGITITFIDDKAVIVDVDESSVAAEDNQIQVGDILHELNGKVLHSGYKGKLSSLMKSKNKPVLVKLIKSKYPENGSVYPPIELLLKKANIDAQLGKSSLATVKNRKTGLTSKCKRNEVNYVGSVDIGQVGHVQLIEQAIIKIINRNSDYFKRVRIEYQELGLKIIDVTTGEQLMANSFLEISSCGQTKKHPNYFGYIAGDNVCNLASKFTCHVFQTDCDIDIENILRSIGDGFQRTHFAV